MAWYSNTVFYPRIMLPNTKQNLEDLIQGVRDRKIEWFG